MSTQSIIINNKAFDFPKDLVSKYLVGNSEFSDSYTYEFPEDSADSMAENLRILMGIDIDIDVEKSLKVNGIHAFLEFIDKLFTLDDNSLGKIKDLSTDFKNMFLMYYHCRASNIPPSDIGFNAEFEATFREIYEDTPDKLLGLNCFNFDMAIDTKIKCTPGKGNAFWTLIQGNYGHGEKRKQRLPERIYECIFNTLDKLLSRGIDSMSEEELLTRDFSKNLFNFIVYKYYIGLLVDSNEQDQ